jgi:hypothetical protein
MIGTDVVVNGVMKRSDHRYWLELIPGRPMSPSLVFADPTFILPTPFIPSLSNFHIGSDASLTDLVRATLLLKERTPLKSSQGRSKVNM